jgi:demethylmenaquinone methyltransferase/2-methoxy-6-polyprenyl-1,4-benzoquinol methylase
MKWSSSTATEVVPNPVEIRQIFTQVAPWYDFLNGFLSFQLDRSWRGRAVEAVVDGHEESILDIGTGTGKLLDAFLSRHPFKRAGGIDLCESMLRKAGTGLKGQAVLLASDVSQCVCFKGESFDIVSSSFTLRSLPNLKTFFQEVHRILKRNGKIESSCK